MSHLPLRKCGTILIHCALYALGDTIPPNHAQFTAPLRCMNITPRTRIYAVPALDLRPVVIRKAHNTSVQFQASPTRRWHPGSVGERDAAALVLAVANRLHSEHARLAAPPLRPSYRPWRVCAASYDVREMQVEVTSNQAVNALVCASLFDPSRAHSCRTEIVTTADHVPPSILLIRSSHCAERLTWGMLVLAHGMLGDHPSPLRSLRPMYVHPALCTTCA